MILPLCWLNTIVNCEQSSLQALTFSQGLLMGFGLEWEKLFHQHTSFTIIIMEKELHHIPFFMVGVTTDELFTAPL